MITSRFVRFEHEEVDSFLRARSKKEYNLRHVDQIHEHCMQEITETGETNENDEDWAFL